MFCLEGTLMNHILAFRQRQTQPGLPAWPNLLAWIVCGTAVIHTGLLFTLTDLRTSHDLLIQLLYPLGMAGAAVILLMAAWLHPPGPKRWAWLLQMCSLVCGLVRALLLIRARFLGVSDTTNLTDSLYILMYGFALSCVALYLPWRVWWLGTAPRVMIDSALVGVATLVILHSTIPLAVTPWTPTRSHVLVIPAFNVAALFAVGTVSLRYGRRGGPLLAFALASLVCLFCGDTIATVVQLLPGMPPTTVSVAPLYTLHYVLLALGAYRSAERPPQAPDIPYSAMPFTHWILWSLLPRILLLTALGATLALVSAPLSIVLTLLVLATIRELIAAYDQRRVLHALHAAQEQADRGATQMLDFLARIVHDLAAPLQGLHTIVASTERTSPNAVGGPLYEQVAHLDHLIDQLRSYLQSRTMPLSLGSVDLAHACAAALGAAQGRADVQRVNLRLVFELDTALVMADAGALRRVLDNLLLNAIAASSPGDDVVLRVQSDDPNTITLTVIDKGKGLPPDQQARIFEPLVRFRGGSGLGLGLAIVRELTRAMHGEYGVVSTVGIGSAFWIRLPRVRDESRKDSYANRLSN
jgi:signal transduction histidine kinase